MTATLDQQTVQGWGAALDEVHGRLRPHFGRAESRRRVRRYVEGLLGPTERKNGWQLAEQAGEATPYGMQRLLAGAKWDADAVRDALGLPLVSPRSSEEAARGAATLAAIAVGELTAAEATARLVHVASPA